MTRVDLCACCGRPIPEGRMVCPRCEKNQCGHVWDFRGFAYERDGKKYFRYKCLRCGDQRLEPVSDVREMYRPHLEDESDGEP